MALHPHHCIPQCLKQSLVCSWCLKKVCVLNVKPAQIDKGKLTTIPGSQTWASERRSLSHTHWSIRTPCTPSPGPLLGHPQPPAPSLPPGPHPWIFCWAALLSSTSFWLVSSRSRAARSSCSYTLACCSFTCRSMSSCLVRYWGWGWVSNLSELCWGKCLRLGPPPTSRNRFALGYSSAAEGGVKMVVQ